MRQPNFRHLRRLYSTKASPDSPREILAGTVLQHHLYVVLRTPDPIRTLESRRMFQLGIDLQRAMLPHDGLVNMGFIADNRSWRRSEKLCRSQLASHGSEEDEFDEEFDDDEERYDAVAFAPDRPPLHIRGVSRSNLEQHADTTRLVQRELPPLRRFAPGEYDGPVHIYVCTHAQRDCRCGEHGGGLVDALVEEVKRRRAKQKGKGWDRFVIGEAAHVGGHKYVLSLTSSYFVETLKYSIIDMRPMP